MARKFLHWTLKDIAEVIDKAIENDFDFNMLIEGFTGLGKSTLLYKILTRCKLPYNPKKDLLFNRNKIIGAISSKQKGCIHADELINIAYKRDFYERGQKELIKALSMYRDSNNVFGGCIPRFVDLDSDLQALCKLRFTVLRRGFALIHKRVSSIYTKDPWDIKNNMKIEAKWTAKRSRKPRYMNLTTCIGYVTYGDLTEQQKKIYLAIKHERRNKIYAGNDAIEMAKNPNVIFYKNLFDRVLAKRITPATLNDICAINGRSLKVVRTKLNDMLKEKGYNERAKDLIKFENLVSRKDDLGFKVLKE